ncbi:MAG TPA: M14 metallopeptidase family protein [Thermoanaerobaculia bacterium]|nr:M14 metallopeptidase family protein [Thermoanaerobaculia bacterium]
MIRKTSAFAAALAFVATLSLAQTAPPATAAGASIVAPLSRGETVDLPSSFDPKVPRPDDFLGYPLGARFTNWDRIVAYLEAVDAASPRMRMWEYGRTYEGRPLKLLAISSPENLERLDEIRQDVERLGDAAGLAPGEKDRLIKKTPLVMWMAYGVHGNESSSAEAAMGAVYALTAGEAETAAMLRSLVVLIDPLSNPDGRERYVNGFKQRVGDGANPRRSAAEHFEPWPGGRQNHYMIDLNRDWAWASQQETRHRIAAYRQWEPQIYVDFHEMGSESSYFFPPPSEPIHPQIDRRVLSWLDTFGRGNAAAFDRQGWIYFKGENYDLFYPGYGDSYPSLRGAVGMTYEMAGGGRAGLALTLPDGSTLTLADRVARHLTTSLSTVRTAAQNARRLLEDFVANRDKAASEPVRTYLWPAEQQEARALAELLALHGVRVRQLDGAVEAPVRSLEEREETEARPRRFAAGTYAVSTAQPLGNLIETLLALDSPMTDTFVDRQRKRLEQNLDPEFYDITAWSLPLAYNVRTWVASGEIGRNGRPLPESPAGGIQGNGDLGYLVPPQGIGSYRLAIELERRKIRFRVAMTSLSSEGQTFPAGTLFIPRGGSSGNLRETLGELLQKEALTAQAIASSYEIGGTSLGSRDVAAVRPSRVGLVSGEGVDATSFGFLWHLLDRQVGMDHDRLDLAQLRQLDLSEFDVLIFPSGNYEDRLGEKGRGTVDAWVKAGGVLVAVGDAVTWLQDHEMTSIKRWQPPKKDDGEDEEAKEDPEDGETALEQELARRPLYTPGAVLATRMQPQHPLTLGLTAPPSVLVEGTTVLKPTGDPRQDVLVAVDESPVLAGFAWPEAADRLSGSLLVGMEERGQGSVVLFAQDPAFRLFWRGTTPILLNTLIYGPSAGVGGRY